MSLINYKSFLTFFWIINFPSCLPSLSLTTYLNFLYYRLYFIPYPSLIICRNVPFLNSYLSLIITFLSFLICLKLLNVHSLPVFDYLAPPILNRFLTFLPSLNNLTCLLYLSFIAYLSFITYRYLIDNLSSLTFPKSLSLSTFTCLNDYLSLLSYKNQLFLTVSWLFTCPSCIAFH